jgi:hypothetical protein
MLRWERQGESAGVAGGVFATGKRDRTSPALASSTFIEVPALL